MKILKLQFRNRKDAKNLKKFMVNLWEENMKLDDIKVLHRNKNIVEIEYE
ncbi:MAG: hypothetical protein WCK29_01560 [archaeon]